MKPIQDTAKAWVAKVNEEGGLNGHPVQLLLADEGGDPGRAQAIAQRMVQQDKIQAFFALGTVTTQQAITPVAEKHQIPILGTCHCNPADVSPMVFLTGTYADTGTAWLHALPILKNTDRRKAALFYCREAQTCAIEADVIKKEVTKAYPDLKIVYEAQVSLAQPSFLAELIAANNAGADALIAIVDNASTVRIVKEMGQQGYDWAYSSQHSGSDERILEQGGDAIEGIFNGSQTVNWQASPLMADYRAAMDKYNPGGVKGGLGPSTWGAGKLLEKVAVQFGPNVTNLDILAGLWSLKEETLGGIIPPMTWPKDVGGLERSRLNMCTYPLQVKGGKFVAPNGDEPVCAPGWKPYGS